MLVIYLSKALGSDLQEDANYSLNENVVKLLNKQVDTTPEIVIF